MTKQLKLSALSTAIIFLILNPTAQAQDSAQLLDKVQVTATRLDQPIDRSTASITVIDRADIEASQAIDVADLLAQQVGIDVVRTGGTGSQTSIFMRGGNSNHTLVLIDGIRVNSATQGLYDFAHLALANVERIEIVRGPRASVWGSDSISGVIQIFTRAPKALSVELRTGSFQRYGGDIGYGMGNDENNFGLIGGYESLQGFSATNANNLWSYDPDNDGYQNTHFGLNAQKTIGSQALAFSGLISEADIEFDQGETKSNTYNWQASVSGQVNTIWNQNLNIGQSYEKLDTPAYTSVFGSTRNSIDWINTLSSSPTMQWVLGVNWAQVEGYSNGYDGPEYDEKNHNTGAFVVFNSNINNHNFELATRYDDNSQFGSKSTSSVGWSWQINEGNRVRASWGQGFRAPNFNELYYPGFFGFYEGNPDLKPEQSNSTELGYNVFLSKNINLELSVYNSSVNDLISFSGINSQAININKARMKGLEADLNGETGAWLWRAQGSYSEAINEETNQQLLRRPELKGFASVSYQFGNDISLGSEISAFSNRADISGNLPGYTLINVLADWDINPQWQIEARLENLFNIQYQLLDGYNTADRSVFIRIIYQAK
ncbi:MAG: TonB-dependent receptor [Arenimonas sp.]|nr:TonB-dependent receptor [Arenimonas sp.]